MNIENNAIVIRQAGEHNAIRGPSSSATRQEIYVMLPQSTYMEIDLAPGRAFSLHHAKDFELRCLGGRIWLTEENGGTDVVLRAGQRYRLRTHGMAVLQSLDAAQPARFRVAPVCRPRRLPGWLRRWITAADCRQPTSEMSG